MHPLHPHFQQAEQDCQSYLALLDQERDALTGQDAVVMARDFNDRIGISGIVLTRVDGDGRGGAPDWYLQGLCA